MEVKLREDHIKEICRYSGFGPSTPDEQALMTIRDCMDEMNRVAKPAYVYNEVEACDFLTGEDIKKHLEGCTSIILLAATIGADVDGAIRKASYRDVTRQLYLDACASTLIEELCDTLEANIRADIMERGQYLTWRFSPGYGDLPIDIQGRFLAALNATRRIGLNVSGSGILIPSKSVTAVMGISPEGNGKNRGAILGCASCNIKDTCYLRRQGTPCGMKKK